MKALKIIKRQQVDLIDLPEPQVSGPDQVKIRVRASSICNQHEYKVYTGLYQGNLNPEYPCEAGFPGHEGAGEVVETGSSVKSLQPGDTVILCGWAGHLHQEYIVCGEDWPVKVRTDLPSTAIAPTEIYGCTRALIEKAEAVGQSRCVVIGLGPAGLTAIEWFRLFGAAEIICADLIDDKLAKGLEMGADSAVNVKDKRKIAKLTGSRPGIVMDCSGSHEGFRLAFAMAGREALLFGYNDKPFKVVQGEWLEKSLSIKTQFAFGLVTWRRTGLALGRGFINPGKIVSHVLPFSAESYRHAMDLLKQPGTCKVVLDFGKEGS